MDALTRSTFWKEYISTGLPLDYNVSWPALVSYTFLFLGLYCLINSLWAYFQIITMNTPPGPTPMPFLGNFGIMFLPRWRVQLLQYMDSAQFKRPSSKKKRRPAFLYPHVILTNAAKLYGKIFGLFIGTRLIVILSDFDTVKDAMVNHSEVFSDRPSVPMVQIITKRKGRIMGYCRRPDIILYFRTCFGTFYISEKFECFTKLISNMHFIDQIQ